MDSSQDLSLPRTAPNTERHRATLNGQYKFAIYTIAELDQGSLRALQRDLNAAEYCHNTCALAPQPNFAGRPLRDVFDYHVRVRDEDQTVHPLFFIVATDTDYTSKGVIVVHLDTGQDEQEDRVDQGRCGVDRAASWGMNIDIGNMDWEDLKEEEQEEWSQSDAVASEPSQSAPAPTPAVHWQYGCWSMVPNVRDLPGLLEPGYERKPADRRRVQMAGNYSSQSDAWAQIVKLHPWFCKSHPTTHRQVAICVDEPDFENEGVLIVRYDWDGNVDIHDDSEIVGLHLSCEKVKRIPASRIVAELDDYCGENGLPQAIDS